MGNAGSEEETDYFTKSMKEMKGRMDTFDIVVQWMKANKFFDEEVLKTTQTTVSEGAKLRGIEFPQSSFGLLTAMSTAVFGMNKDLGLPKDDKNIIIPIYLGETSKGDNLNFSLKISVAPHGENQLMVAQAGRAPKAYAALLAELDSFKGLQKSELAQKAMAEAIVDGLSKPTAQFYCSCQDKLKSHVNDEELTEVVKILFELCACACIAEECPPVPFEESEWKAWLHADDAFVDEMKKYCDEHVSNEVVAEGEVSPITTIFKGLWQALKGGSDGREVWIGGRTPGSAYHFVDSMRKIGESPKKDSFKSFVGETPFCERGGTDSMRQELGLPIKIVHFTTVAATKKKFEKAVGLKKVKA